MVAARHLRLADRLRPLALLVLLVVMHFASPYFFTEGNMQNVAKNFSFIAIATLGITFVIITGGIDLSVGSMMCFSAMITSMVMSGLSTPGMPGASLFVHLAADGKTVVANVPGLILLISMLAGLVRRADRRARQRLLHRRARAVALRHHARHALDRARPRLRRLERPGQFSGRAGRRLFLRADVGRSCSACPRPSSIS